MYITQRKKNRPTDNIIDALFDGMPVVTGIPESDEEVVRTITRQVTPESIDSAFVLPERQYLDSLHDINFACSMHPEPETEYITFTIPKKTRGYRTINAPKDNLKEDMSRVSNILTNRLHILAHDSAWAYVKGRDVVGAMKEHKNNNSRWFLKIDLKDFFGSCSPEFVLNQLKNIYPFAHYINRGSANMKDYTLSILTKLSNFAALDGGLPQGTPLSPVLTNLIMVELDYKINKLLNTLPIHKQRYVYTRYADDIIISAKESFPYQTIIDALNEEVFKNTPLNINTDKTRYGSNAGRNWNLGVMYNKDNNLTVGYKRKKRLKVILYQYITCESRWDLDELRWLLGQLSWLKNVEPEYYTGLVDYFKNKYNTDIHIKIISDIKSYNN